MEMDITVTLSQSSYLFQILGSTIHVGCGIHRYIYIYISEIYFRGAEPFFLFNFVVFFQFEILAWFRDTVMSISLF